MPQTINQVFDFFHIDDEQLLVEDLIIESIQIFGLEVLYIPRKYINLDRYYGEDVISSFERSYPIEMYIKNITSYDGQREFMSKFDIQLRNEISFNVAIRRFDEMVIDPHKTQTTETLLRPKEGDLIYFTLDKRLFEISNVEKRSVFFQIGNLYMYELNCKQFEISGERFKTGNDQIDIIEDMNNYEVTLEVTSGFGDYILGEKVSLGDFSGIVTEWNVDTSKLSLMRPKNELPITGLLTGETSGATYMLASDVEIEQNTNEPIVDNDVSKNVEFLLTNTNPLSG